MARLQKRGALRTAGWGPSTATYAREDNRGEGWNENAGGTAKPSPAILFALITGTPLATPPFLCTIGPAGDASLPPASCVLLLAVADDDWQL